MLFIFARILLLGLVSSGISHAIFILPGQFAEGRLSAVAGEIIEGQAFDNSALSAYLPISIIGEAAVPCRPTRLRNGVILRLRLLEVAQIADDKREVAELSDSLDSAVVRSLRCSPSDPFLWLVLFATKSSKHFEPDQIRFLSMSYRTGPNEGWVALKRNQIALSYFSFLPAQDQELVLTEYSHLVDMGAYDIASAAFMRSSQILKERLYERFSSISPEHRATFEAALGNAGYSGPYPWQADQPQRPWERPQ